jgi:soluble lytic murein transglycosylase-like protein
MRYLVMLLILTATASCFAGVGMDSRQEAEYYVSEYARHYGVPVEFVRALVEQESGWHACAVSNKGAVGLMQLMPATARLLNVQDRCNVEQNVSGGVRHLAYLMDRFHGDLRLVAAAYYAGEKVVGAHGLNYANPDVVAYVQSVRIRFEREKKFRSVNVDRTPRSKR